jgi:hypothetical protein
MQRHADEASQVCGSRRFEEAVHGNVNAKALVNALQQDGGQEGVSACLHETRSGKDALCLEQFLEDANDLLFGRGCD